MFVTEDNYKVGLRVKINPRSRYAYQMIGSAYGITQSTEDCCGGWVSVMWYDRNGKQRFDNTYRISLGVEYGRDVSKTYDLILDKKEQLEFEF